MSYMIAGSLNILSILDFEPHRQIKPTSSEIVSLCLSYWIQTLKLAYTGLSEWYPQGLQISLHIRSPGLQDYSEVWIWSFSNFWGGILKLSDFGLSDNFHFGGVFWNSQIWTLWQFSFWGGILKLSDLDSDNFHLGGYSETLGFGLSDNFHFWGVFWNSQIWTLTIFIWGGILKLSDLDSLTILILAGYSETLGFGISDNFHWGGYSETLGFGLSDNFHFGGGVSETLRFGLSDNFLWGGVFWNSRIWTLWQFSFWRGSFLKLSDLDSLTIFFGGGVFWNSQIWTLWQFSFGGYSGTLRFGLWQFSLVGYSVLQNSGILRILDQNFNHSSRLMHHR